MPYRRGMQVAPVLLPRLSTHSPPIITSSFSPRHRQKTHHAAACASNARAEAAGLPPTPSPLHSPPCHRGGDSGRPAPPFPSGGPRRDLPLHLPSFGGRGRDRHAPPRPHPGSHMVLQHAPLPACLYGQGSPRSLISLTLDGAAAPSAATVVDAVGKWVACLPPQQAGGPHTVTIAGSGGAITLERGPFWRSLAVRGAKQHAYVFVTSLERHRRNCGFGPRKRRRAPPASHGHRPQHLCRSPRRPRLPPHPPLERGHPIKRAWPPHQAWVGRTGSSSPLLLFLRTRRRAGQSAICLPPSLTQPPPPFLLLPVATPGP